MNLIDSCYNHQFHVTCLFYVFVLCDYHQYHGVLVRWRCSFGDTFTCNCPILVLNKVYYYYYYYYYTPNIFKTQCSCLVINYCYNLRPFYPFLIHSFTIKVFGLKTNFQKISSCFDVNNHVKHTFLNKFMPIQAKNSTIFSLMFLDKWMLMMIN